MVYEQLRSNSEPSRIRYDALFWRVIHPYTQKSFIRNDDSTDKLSTRQAGLEVRLGCMKLVLKKKTQKPLFWDTSVILLRHHTGMIPFTYLAMLTRMSVA